jgi:hypothetical protein
VTDDVIWSVPMPSMAIWYTPSGVGPFGSPGVCGVSGVVSVLRSAQAAADTRASKATQRRVMSRMGGSGRAGLEPGL